MPETVASDSGVVDSVADSGRDTSESPGDCTGKTLATCLCANDAACARFDDADRCNGHLICKDNRCVLDAASVVTCDTSTDPVCGVTKCDPTDGVCKLGNAPNTTPCDDGLFCTVEDRCSAGVCTGTARLCSPSCTHCDETASACVPNAGSCVIDGSCVSMGSPSPLAPCLVCDPAASTRTWSPRAAGATCPLPDSCSASAACDGAGVCVAAPLAPAVPTLTAPLYGSRIWSRKPTFRWSVPTASCATTYDIEVDNSCATNIESCTFASPEARATVTAWAWTPTTDLPVSTIAPVGARYVWRVRACSGTACSAWTAPQLFDLGRPEKDVNGDGYSDLVVAAPNNGSNKGRVYVFLGSSSGPAATPSFTLTPPPSGTRLGNAVTLGDVNGDGFADIVALDSVPAPGYTSSARFAVYHGSAAGPATTPSTVVSPPTASPYAEAPISNRAFAGSDIDGDGFADVVVAADQGGTDPPSAYIFRGSASGLSTTISWTLPNRKPTSTYDYDHVHGITAEGDFTGDGLPDVILTHTSPTSSGVQLSLYRGVRGGPPVFVNKNDKERLDMGVFFGGHPLSTSGDINGDGRADLLFAARTSGTGYGEFPIRIYYGNSTLVAPPSVVLEPTPSSGFGTAMVARDFDGDGRCDLVIGTPGDGTSSAAPGRALFYRGPISGTTLPTIMRNDSTTSKFGAAVEAAGDVNGDGYPDVAIGAYRYNGTTTSSGRAYIFLGGVTGLGVNPSFTFENPTADWDGNFGFQLGH